MMTRVACILAVLLIVSFGSVDAQEPSFQGSLLGIETSDFHLDNTTIDAPEPSGWSRFIRCLSLSDGIRPHCLIEHESEGTNTQVRAAMNSRHWRMMLMGALQTYLASRRTTDMLRDFIGQYDYAKDRIAGFTGVVRDIEGYMYEHSVDRFERTEASLETLYRHRMLRSPANRWEELEILLNEQITALEQIDEYAARTTSSLADIGRDLGFQSSTRIAGNIGVIGSTPGINEPPPPPIYDDEANPAEDGGSLQAVLAARSQSYTEVPPIAFADNNDLGEDEMSDSSACPIDDMAELPAVIYQRAEVAATGTRIGSGATRGEAEGRLDVIRSLRNAEIARQEYLTHQGILRIHGRY